tara:strand:+ start:421 stop:780 length:360 start_codon:yes stop_codon:yes gene_type:complete
MPRKSISGRKVGIEDYDSIIEVGNKPQNPKPKHPVRDESLGQKKGKGAHSGRVTVRIKSSRSRLLDTDNLIGGVKYFVDGLRHAGLIHDDREEDIILEVSQTKVSKKEKEKTEIELIYP